MLCYAALVAAARPDFCLRELRIAEVLLQASIAYGRIVARPRYSMVCYGVVWYSMLWYAMVCYGMLWYAMVC